MFGREQLHQVVEIVGRALREEDAEIRDAILANPCYKDGPAGLRRVDNERYYQYLAWKALVTSRLPFCVLLERDHRDLWICGSSDEQEPLAIGEMKRWVESYGEDVRGIEADIKKLRVRTCPGFMLVTTEFDPRGDDQYQWLAKRLSEDGFPIRKEEFEICSFPTACMRSRKREELEFALIGFLVTAYAERARPTIAG